MFRWICVSSSAPGPSVIASWLLLLLPRSAGCCPPSRLVTFRSAPSGVASLRRPGSNQWRRGRLSFPTKLLLADNLRTRNRIASQVGGMSSDDDSVVTAPGAMAHKRRSAHCHHKVANARVGDGLGRIARGRGDRHASICPSRVAGCCSTKAHRARWRTKRARAAATLSSRVSPANFTPSLHPCRQQLCCPPAIPLYYFLQLSNPDQVSSSFS